MVDQKISEAVDGLCEVVETLAMRLVRELGTNAVSGIREQTKAIRELVSVSPMRQVFRTHGLEVMPLEHRALLDGQELNLSKYEFSLLALLASEPDRVFTKQELLRDVWGFESLCRTRTLDSHASRLRGKLGRNTGWIMNVWGVGYRLIESTTVAAPSSKSSIKTPQPSPALAACEAVS